jgi:hypothetical protein
VFAPSQALTAVGQETRQEGGTAPAAGARTVEPRRPAATRGQTPCPHTTTAITETDSKTETGQQSRNTLTPYKHPKSVVLASRVASDGASV